MSKCRSLPASVASTAAWNSAAVDLCRAEIGQKRAKMTEAWNFNMSFNDFHGSSSINWPL